MLSRLKHLFNKARNHAGFRRYAANTSWMFAEQLLRMAAGLLVGIWVARYLGPEQFGLFSYAIAFTSLFGSLAKLGLDSIVVRELVRTPELRDVYLGTAFWLKLMGAVVMLAAMAVAVQFTSNDATTNLYIFIIGSGTLFQSFEVVDFYFQSKVLSKFVSICKLTQLVISSLIKLYLIFIKAELSWFVLVSLVDQVTLAASLFLAYRYQKLRNFYSNFAFSVAKILLNNSWPLIISGLVVMIYMRIDQIMIKEMLGEYEVGIYSAAVRLSEVWYFIPVLITNSLFPALINAKTISNENYYIKLQKLFTFLIWISVVMAIITSLINGIVINLLFGLAYKDAASILAINIWAGIFVSLGVAQGKFWLINNLQNKVIYITASCALLNILLNLILIPVYGPIGAAAATLLSYAIGSLVFPLFIGEAKKMIIISYKAFLFWVN